MDREAVKAFSRTAFKVRQGFIWFLRFVSVFLLLAVITLAVQWKLPWKITTVLLMVPVLGIVVPRKLLVWVWLLPLAAFASVYLWIHLPEQNDSEWQTYRYNIEHEVTNANWDIADANNAATGYDAILAEYGESVFGYQFLSDEAKDATFNGPWRQDDFPRLAAWLKTFDEGIAALVKASRMPDCRFAVAYDQPTLNAQQKRLNQLKGWTRLVLRSANLDLGEGRFEAGLEKQLAVIRLSQHLYNQHSLFDQSAAFDIELLASRVLETTIIHHCSDPKTLAALEAAFGDLDSGWAKSWAAIIEREKLLVKTIGGMFYEIDSHGRLRISHRSMYALQEGLGYQPQRLFLKQHEMNRLAVIAMRLSLPFTPEGMARLIDQRFDHYSLQTQKGDTPEYIPPQRVWTQGVNCKSVIDWQARQQVRWFWALDGQHKRHLALKHLVQIFAALKRYQLEHGCWPQALCDTPVPAEALEDPVHGRPFAYRRMNGDFYLYSLGPNGADDNGLNDPQNKQDDILFWPRGTLDEAIRKSPPADM